MPDREQLEANARQDRGRGVVARRVARGVLTRRLHRSLNRGEISQADHDKFIYALKKDGFVEAVLDKAEEERSQRAEFYKSDGDRPILDWIEENWVEILRVLVSLLPLLLI